jgi:flagellar hook-basal body complex protein FliE
MFGKAIASVPEALSSWPALGHTITSFGDAFKSIVTGSGAATQAASQNINYYKGLISQFTGAQQTLFKVAGATMQQNSVGYVQALGLMDAAGVKSGETFQEDMTQVEGLIQGYKNLGVQGGALGNSINAITLQTEQQETEISKITGAWTNFITLVTGGESSFVTVAQQVQGTMAAAGGAASGLSISNGKVTDSIKDASAAAGGAKVNIDSLSTAGLALKSSFIQTVQAMSGNINNLMQLSSASGEGAAGLKQVDLSEVVIAYWAKALEGYEARMIDAAFQKYWLTGEFFPVPANIIELIKEQIVAEAPGPGEVLRKQLQ